ncbi:MAG: hypothetical protein KIH69_023415 [Anaerolineae bacterium]|nr:hypothetical protein [Anaerolineae bacterium]
MTQINPVTLQVPFEVLFEAVKKLDFASRLQLLDWLEGMDDDDGYENSATLRTEIAEAKAEYAAGKHISLELYRKQRGL